MCATCWKEAGSPTISNLKTERLISLMGELYKVHLTGGWCHICTDDYNLSGRDVEWVQGEASLHGDAIERTVAGHLSTMTENERYSAVHQFWLGLL